MDAFELLLRASEPDIALDTEFKEEIAASKPKATFDYRDHMTNTMLDPIDSIMMLADQACQKSPIRKPGRDGAHSPPLGSAPALNPTMGEFGDDSKGMGTLLQYGSYFNNGSPFANPNNRRLRAMSEPWLRQDAWSEDLQFNRAPGPANGSALLGGLNGSGAGGSSMFPPFSFGDNRDSSQMRLGLLNAEHRLGYSSLESSLPHMLDQYAAIYNKNGRIGIYTREERSAIIHRFREKRKRRVWKKKIRYFCRKNLADRRVRVKGRFVKSAAKAPGASGASTSSTGSDQSPSASTGGTSRSASDRGGSAQAAAVARPSHQRTHSGSGDGTDVSDLTGVTYSNPRAPRPAAAKGVRSAARQALTSPGSDDDEDEDDEDDEGSDGGMEGDDGNYSMEVVIGSNSDAGSSGTGTSAAEAERKPRLLKLVLTSSAAGHTDSAPHSAASAGSNGKLVFRAPVKSEPGATDSTSAAAEISSQDMSGVDILASLAAQAASESDPDDLEDGDGDVFTAERDLMRLPSAKRIRRHSIAY